MFCLQDNVDIAEPSSVSKIARRVLRENDGRCDALVHRSPATSLPA